MWKKTNMRILTYLHYAFLPLDATKSYTWAFKICNSATQHLVAKIVLKAGTYVLRCMIKYY